MKKLLTYIIITACLFFVIDRLLGLGLKQLYQISNATDEYKISYSNEGTLAPILFFGSSRCLHHYVPSIFEDTLGKECFNTGDWGIKNIYYHYGLLGNILTRYTPQIIIFEIHPCDWLDTPFSGTERATSLAPYCGKSKECDEMLQLTGKLWAYQLSMVYRYTGSLPNLLLGKLGAMNRNLKGWKPMDGILDTTGVKAEEYPFPVSEKRTELFEKFITTCKEHHIRLVLAVSPMYICSKKDVLNYPHQLAIKHHIPFLDHYRDSAFVGHSDLFFDYGHLNRQGAERYSKMVCKELKEILNN